MAVGLASLARFSLVFTHLYHKHLLSIYDESDTILGSVGAKAHTWPKEPSWTCGLIQDRVTTKADQWGSQRRLHREGDL